MPKAGGGLYWCDDTPDHRDFMKGFDTNDRMKRDLFADILKRLQDGNWLKEEKQNKNIEGLIEEAMAVTTSPLMRGAQFLGIIEYAYRVDAPLLSFCSFSMDSFISLNSLLIAICNPGRTSSFTHLISIFSDSDIFVNVN